MPVATVLRRRSEWTGRTAPPPPPTCLPLCPKLRELVRGERKVTHGYPPTLSYVPSNKPCTHPRTHSLIYAFSYPGTSLYSHTPLSHPSLSRPSLSLSIPLGGAGVKTSGSGGSGGGVTVQAPVPRYSTGSGGRYPPVNTCS